MEKYSIKVIDFGGGTQNYWKIVAFTHRYLNKSKFYKNKTFATEEHRIRGELYCVAKIIKNCLKNDFR